jgi:hypothetical protein
MIRMILLVGLIGAEPAHADPVARWVAAQDLAALARAERDGVLLAAAARQLALAEAEDGSLAAAPRNAATILEEAQALAGSDPVGRAVVGRYAGLTSRGSPEGKALQTVSLKPGAEIAVPRTFKAGQSAIVYSEARGPFRLSVENGGATPVCRRSVSHGAALCRWVAGATGEVRIRLTNAAPEPQQLTLITN